MIVKIRKARASNWTGLKTFTGGYTRLVAEIDKRTGNVITGLTKEEAKEIEEELNYPAGTLAYNSPFWDEYQIRLMNAEGEFNLDLAEDRLKYLVLKPQKKVAKGLAELYTNANAEYVMYSDEDEAKEQNVKFDIEVESMVELGKLYSSLEDMRNVLTIYGQRADTISLDVAKSLLIKQVKLNPKKFLEIVKDPDFKSKIFIHDLTKVGILGKKGSAYTFDGEVIAYSLDDMINYSKKKENSNIILAMKSQLKEKKK